MTTQTTHTATIAGQVYTFFRPAADLPFAEVWIERADGATWAVNTQYAFWEGEVNPRAFVPCGDTRTNDELLPIAVDIVAEASAYHRLNAAATRAHQDAADMALSETPAPIMPDDVQALFARYGSADAAWDAEDDMAWARMSAYEPVTLVAGLPEDH